MGGARGRERLRRRGGKKRERGGRSKSMSRRCKVGGEVAVVHRINVCNVSNWSNVTHILLTIYTHFIISHRCRVSILHVHSFHIYYYVVKCVSLAPSSSSPSSHMPHAL